MPPKTRRVISMGMLAMLKEVMDPTAREDQINLQEETQDHATLADEQFSKVENYNAKHRISSEKILKSVNHLIF